MQMNCWGLTFWDGTFLTFIHFCVIPYKKIYKELGSINMRYLTILLKRCAILQNRYKGKASLWSGFRVESVYV